MPDILAFPGADGFGKYVTGARNPSAAVLVVTNLNDSGAGSLRAALETEGNAYVVFAVGGVITLNSLITINSARGNKTILGQTAPFPGITTRGAHIRIENSQNVILRYIRSTSGVGFGVTGDSNRRGITFRAAKGVILDHCSFNWTIDETITTLGLGAGASGDDWKTEGATIQYCFATESLNNADHTEGAHGFGLFLLGKNFSFHHNLTAAHTGRNPFFAEPTNITVEERSVHYGLMDYRNNLCYNTHDGATGYRGQINYMNNMHLLGPNSRTRRSNMNRVWNNPIATAGYPDDRIYLEGNVIWGSEGLYTQAELIRPNGTGSAPADFATFLRSTPNPVPEGVYNFKEDAYESMEKILKYGGMNLYRSIHDSRIVRNVRDRSYDFNGTSSIEGIIDHQDNVGGYWQPTVKSWAYTDKAIGDMTIQDVIDNANDYDFSDDYPNIEVWANSLVAGIGDVGGLMKSAVTEPIV